MYYTLSEAVAVAAAAGVEVRGASDADLLELWRRGHPHPETRPLPPGRARIIALSWRDERTGSLHARILRAATVNAPGVSRLRLAAALVEVTLGLLGAALPCPTQLSPDVPVQIAAFDAWGQPVRIVRQTPSRSVLLRGCPVPFAVGALAD